MRNVIYLKTKRKLIVQRGSHVLPPKYLATAMKNIEYLGFTFSKQLMDAVRTLSIEEFAALYDQLVTDLKAMIGADVIYKPMYPNFPLQVMLASEAELYIHAIIHYITLALPDYEALDRFPLLDQVGLSIIDLGSEEDYVQMIRGIIQANSSISQQDKENVEWVIANHDSLEAFLPEAIPLKENVGFVVGALLKYGKAETHLIGSYVKTATDVLRLATALSDGDVSLAANTKFRKFKRAERRLLLGLLEQSGSAIVEDMLRNKNRWIRLGEILHPSEYRNQYPRCNEAFDILRNNKPYETFGAKVELSLQYKDAWLAADLLKHRAGEFARRLDHLLRITKEPLLMVYAFEDVADQVSTPVLLQVMTHFTHRNERHELRTFFPKGNVAKAVAIPNTLPVLDPEVCEAVVETCKNTLLNRFSKLPPLGRVYVDESLKRFVVPFSQRSASKALRTIVRGSRLEMPPGSTIRFFTWWKEGMVRGTHTGRVDIDLSAVMYDKKWNYIEHISYTNLRSGKYKAAHSGDITSAPSGACEFIDIDIASVVQYGGRYIVASLNSFTEQPYCDLPECYAGWMMRKYPNEGKIFEPSTVVDKIDIAADTQICIPVIMDVVERTVIWTDLALRKHPDYYNNIEGNQKGMTLMGKAMTSLVKPTLYDLFKLHAAARGQETEREDDAQTVFSVKRGVTPFDTGTILSEYVV
ncbi:cytoplasmic protein [Paenibacillus sp. H1-7]|uniref:TerD family protein n=1 Tax=Paenibacillus sp. H1-7 TaxID=2282849 RepID=UPI001EF991A6|nr:TerD family protein [Paenibacillus sp. H1-7]ULL14155.1 cytoplasmic protein [Paenibacillus sp. H1-7]